MNDPIQVGDILWDGKFYGMVVDVRNDFMTFQWFNCKHLDKEMYLVSDSWAVRAKREWTNAQRQYIKDK
mgnify:FL=1